MEFEKLKFNNQPTKNMIKNSNEFLKMISSRRTVREFSDKDVPMSIIENIIKAASSAPSGANKQPWHFVVVQDPVLKKKIRLAAEEEEKEFYNNRAPDSWLEDLNQFNTDWNKPFLEKAPVLIAVFRQSYADLGTTKKKITMLVSLLGLHVDF